MIDCRTRNPEVPSSNPSVGKKENLSQVQSEQYQQHSLFTRIIYLKLPEVKSRSHSDTVVECRTRDPEVTSPNPSVAKKKISHRSNQNNATTNPSAPELNTRIYQR